MRPRTLPLLVCSALLALLAAAPWRAASAQSSPPVPQVTVSVDKTRVTVGDPINLTVTVRHAPNVTIGTTSIDDQLGKLEPLGSQPADERSVGGDLELRLRYTVAIFETGTIPVPQFAISYTLPDGTQGLATPSTPLSITVESIIPAGENPTDIKGLKPQFTMSVPTSVNWELAAGIAGIVLALVLSGGLAAFVLLRRGRGAPQEHPTPALAARAELDRILALDLPAKGELAEHYRLLAGCIRRFLTERYGFAAVALTTAELEQQMEARGVDRWPARLVCGLLNECDAVVYARYVPAPARAEADNAMAYEIVETMDGAGPRVAVPAG